MINNAISSIYKTTEQQQNTSGYKFFYPVTAKYPQNKRANNPQHSK